MGSMTPFIYDVAKAAAHLIFGSRHEKPPLHGTGAMLVTENGHHLHDSWR